MSRKRLSIIIPVYNVEEYLEDCVHSLLNQTYQNLEKDLLYVFDKLNIIKEN